MNKLVYLILVAASGCATSPHSHYLMVPPEPARPIPAPWSDGQVVTYYLGRTVVGLDGNVIHEAHPVYRRENSGQPQLMVPSAAWAIPTATTNTVQEQVETLRAETSRTRDLSRQVLRAGEELVEQVKPIKAVIESNQALHQQVRELNQTISNLNTRVSRFEGRAIPGPGEARPATAR
jgi:hypothetical protein